MDVPRPFPSSLSSSQPPSLSHPRHRRAAFSGRLLNLFTKVKSVPEQPRPVISHPQPLQSRIPSRPKRVYRELSNDENEPPSSSPRPHFRARLHSNSSIASNDTILRSPSPGRKLHTPPRGNSGRPLKSALKKFPSENAPPPASLHSRGLSSSSLPPDTLLKSPRSKVTTRIPGGHWMPFSSSSRNHATRAASEVSDPRPLSNGARHKKTVSFALDEPEPRSSTSKLPRVSSSGELSHWDEIAQELDAPATSRAPSMLKRKAEDYPDSRRSLVSPRLGSPTMTRMSVFKPESSPPVSFRRPLSSRRVPNDESHPVDEPNDADKLMARHLPHTLAPSEFARRPARTFIGGIVDEAMQECAREKILSPPRNVKASARSMDGPSGVLRRITADIVPNERHSVVWDASESDTFAWGGTIILRDAKAASYFYPRHCIKDFQLEFCAIPEPRSGVDATSPIDPDAPPTYDWRSSFTGHFLKRHEIRSRLDVVRGIALEPDFVFVKPDDPDGPHAWMVHFWVPVPLALFTPRSVHRTFLCRAKITVGGYDTAETVIPAGCVAAGIESLKSDEFVALAAGVRDGRAEES
ncbi:hypothetical protein LXA43DRAFT_1085553 [Ganoderma leucocontextum]|nr:hypothetical protein LXA43DRAFT_1085553 [Ganoderma leucocontextum]